MEPFDPGVYLSLAFLFGVAAQFRAMDGYSLLRRIVSALETKVGVLAAISIVTVALSPFVLNDVLVLILTPVAVRYARQFRVDPAPIVAAELVFTNISSSLTPFGNPQNIILWSSTGISVFHFVEGTSFRVLAGIALASLVLVPFAIRAGGRRELPPSVGSLVPLAYLSIVSVCLVVGDLAGAPPYVPLGVGFLAGFAVTSREVAAVSREYDVKSLLILGAFVLAVQVASLVVGTALAPLTSPAAAGVQPYSGLFLAGASNLMSNVPATQLVVSTGVVTKATAPLLAAQAGFAGNLGPLASFANILALQMTGKSGVSTLRIVMIQLLVGAVAYVAVLF